MQLDLTSVKRVVIKIGSSVLADSKGLKKDFFRTLVTQIDFLLTQQKEIVIVSSGAVAAAIGELAAARPERIPEKQAFAALGQPLLMHHYIAAFAKKKRRVAQILLTYPDLENRARFLNAKHAFAELLARGIIPIVNENDSVAIDELKFGDNDRLSAHVAELVGADLLIILSHVDGLYDSDPEKNPKAKLITSVTDKKAAQRLVFANKNHLGTGGMATKLAAAEFCAERKISVFITNGNKKDFLKNIFTAKARGTWV